MSGNIDTEPIWSDFTPDEIISEAEIPDRAADLEGMASGWLDDNVRHFDLFEWDGMKERYWKKKAFNEAGVYLINALNHGEDSHTPELKELVLDRVNDRRFSHLISRNPKTIHHFAYPTLYVNYLDALDTEMEEVFEQTVEQGEFWSVERLPYRLLEFCFLSRTMGIKYEHDEETIIKFTLLNHHPDIIRADYVDTYCLTHDVMFSNYDKIFYTASTRTDGATSIRMSGQYDITNVIRGLILRYMAENNIDIALELLLSGILQRQISREMVRLVISWALEKIREVGYIPGPPEESMHLMSSPKKMGATKETSWDYKHEDEQEAVWAKSYHTNVVAGMTARILKRDWDKLRSRPMDHSFENKSFREETTRLGQLLKSLGRYNIKKGSKQMIELAESPASTEFPVLFQNAVNFLRDQRTQDAKFGYWAAEENLYTNKGKSRQTFRTELVKPVSETCQKALDAVENGSPK